MSNHITGRTFNIQRYSLHDGPGIRTVVFLKGCPLSCRWCSNPESQAAGFELVYRRDTCIGQQTCQLCQTVCPMQAITAAEDDRMAIDRVACSNCLRCTAVCPSQALQRMGEDKSIQDILTVVEADRLFYARSGGGLTVSGGEPLMQPAFLLGLLKEARRRRIHTAMETCGYGDWDVLKQAAEYLQVVLFDIKSMNEQKHRKYTGVSSKVIQENFKRLVSEFPQLPILVRTPVIPGFNDTVEDIQTIADFIQAPQVTYELLKYHRMGEQKYTLLGKEYPLAGDSLPEETWQQIADYAKKHVAAIVSAC